MRKVFKIIICILLSVILLLPLGCSRNNSIIQFIEGETKGSIESSYPPFRKIDLTNNQIEHIIQLINSISYSKATRSVELPEGDIPELHLYSNREEHCLAIFSDTLLALDGLVYDVSASAKTVSELNSLIKCLLEE